jgi:arsenate reductase
MAAAWFNHLADPSKARALSAGTHPADRVHPAVVDAMSEVGIDLSAARPRLLTAELAGGAVALITMGCGDECPFVPGLHVEDWPLPDPKGRDIRDVRETRDEIRRRVVELLERKGWGGHSKS